MNKKNLATLIAATLGLVATLAAASALAEDQRFSLSSGFDSSEEQYETGPWEFKLTAPVGFSVTRNANPVVAGSKANLLPENSPYSLVNTEAAASYNLYTGSATSPEVNLTGKIRVNAANPNSQFGLNQNDYAAQMDIYQNLDKFTAKGTLGSKVLGSETGLTLNPLLYGSFGGLYRLTDNASTGVDMSLSQASPVTGAKQQEISAFVNYQLDNHFKARGYLLRGNSNGTPNNTVGGLVYYGF